MNPGIMRVSDDVHGYIIWIPLIKATKISCQLLYKLPEAHPYKVLYLWSDNILSGQPSHIERILCFTLLVSVHVFRVIYITVHKFNWHKLNHYLLFLSVAWITNRSFLCGFYWIGQIEFPQNKKPKIFSLIYIFSLTKHTFPSKFQESLTPCEGIGKNWVCHPSEEGGVFFLE